MRSADAQRQGITDQYRKGKLFTVSQVLKHNSLDWLAKNYVWMYGLRKWNWNLIINGIIKEHINFLKQNHQDFEEDQI